MRKSRESYSSCSATRMLGQEILHKVEALGVMQDSEYYVKSDWEG